MFSYRPQLITILNSFIRLHPDYRGIVYDQKHVTLAFILNWNQITAILVH